MLKDQAFNVRGATYDEFFITPRPDPEPEDCEGNPCSPATGNKSQIEQDYDAKSVPGLSFSRYYNSQGEYRHVLHMAPGWRSDFSQRMDSLPVPEYVGLAGGEASSSYPTPDAACISGFVEIKSSVWGGTLSGASAEYAGGSLCRIYLGQQTLAWFNVNGGVTVGLLPTSIHTITRANGMTYVFQQTNGQWFDALNPDFKLQAQGTDWVFTDNDNTKETYNPSGQLITITSVSGRTTTLTYDLAIGAGGDDNLDTLDHVSEDAGHFLSFTYIDNAGQSRLSSITTPSGDLVYGYDVQGNLNTVTYPDGESKTYHYEDINFPHHLTGITDERDIRYATWAYNTDGKAILSEHAGGIEQVILTYNPDGTTAVTDSRGANRTYNFTPQRGNFKVTQIVGDLCTDCPNGDKKDRSYDANGYLSSYTDWSNAITEIGNYDAIGQLGFKIEAKGTPDERRSDFTYDPRFHNKTTTITAPSVFSP
ncbi:MAG: DUF6531 domain-containing protein [Gammaproteobacteria bacterium]